MNEALEKILRSIEKIIPKKFYIWCQPAYHFSLAFISALIYRFPSRKIKVIGVTGTKGKSSTTEIINAILEQSGYKTALSNTIRFKIGETSSDNLYKMSMPGRFFIQRFIRKAVKEKCQYVVLEMTSQGSMNFRHKYIDLDAFVFTNLSPEHIESHGSYENYVNAKVKIACEMIKSNKKDRIIIVNSDDKESQRFLSCSSERKAIFSLKYAEPYSVGKQGLRFTLDGETIYSPLSGLFNLYNILASIATTKNLGIEKEIIKKSIENFSGIKGRVEKIEAGQDFTVIVDYAHTTDSLDKLYQVFEGSKNICVLGGTGGGRDVWKRKEMGKIADKYCEEIILTNEDPYDEDPQKIISDVAQGIKDKTPSIILDRRLAIAEAVKRAEAGDVVLITGKGTDPYIMGPNGSKTPWSDAGVVREEIGKLKQTR